MGVKYLDSFIRFKVKKGQIEIDICEEVNRWKKENNGSDQPVIIVDIWALKRDCCGTAVEQMLGGRQYFYLQRLDNLFRLLTYEYGVKLIFVCNNYNIHLDIHQSKKKSEEKLNKLNNSYEMSCQILDNIENDYGNLADGKIIKRAASLGLSLYAGLSITPLKNVCSKYGEMKIFAGSDFDKKVARLATENSAFAVVTNDTDFIIFDGDWKFWSSRIGQEPLKTMEYNRAALLSTLNLRSNQLRILSTVSGNDVINLQQLTRFHSAQNLNYKNYWKAYFEVLANYVIKLPKQMSEVIVKMSKDIFDSDDEEFQAIIKKSLDMYDITSAIISDETNQETDLLLVKAKENRFVYNVMTGRTILLWNRLTDLRRTDFKSYFEIIEPILKRSIGLLRKDNRNDLTYKQVVLTKVAHDEPYRELEVIPVYPDEAGLPDLFQILYKDEYDDNDDGRSLRKIRVELVKWLIFGDTSTDLNIEEIPKDYIVTVLALNYLLKMEQFTLTEADALLLCVFHVCSDVKQISEYCSGDVNTRTILTSHLYAQMHDQIRSCFEMVGLKKFIANDFSTHDGPHFNFLIKDLLSKTADEYTNAIREISYLKRFLHL